MTLQEALIKSGLAQPLPSPDSEPGEAVELHFPYRRPDRRRKYHQRASNTKILEVKRIMETANKDTTAYKLLQALQGHDWANVGVSTNLYKDKHDEAITRHTIGLLLSQLFQAGAMESVKKGTATLYRLKAKSIDEAYARLMAASNGTGKGKGKKSPAPVRQPREGKVVIEIVGKVEIIFKLG